MTLRLVALAWSAAAPEQAQLRADTVSVAVAPSGALDLDLRTSVAETSARAPVSLHENHNHENKWTDMAALADPDTYTQWTFAYQGCLFNASMGGVVSKTTSREAVFDAVSCRNYCGDRVGEGDRIAVRGMMECYCLKADWLPEERSHNVLNADDWTKLASQTDMCPGCKSQTPTGCMLPTVVMPCKGSCGGKCACDECHPTFNEQLAVKYEDYCDIHCKEEATQKCGSAPTTGMYGQEIAGTTAVYLVGKQTAKLPVFDPGPVPCLLENHACPRKVEEEKANATAAR